MSLHVLIVSHQPAGRLFGPGGGRQPEQAINREESHEGQTTRKSPTYCRLRSQSQPPFYLACRAGRRHVGTPLLGLLLLDLVGCREARSPECPRAHAPNTRVGLFARARPLAPHRAIPRCPQTFAKVPRHAPQSCHPTPVHETAPGFLDSLPTEPLCTRTSSGARILREDKAQIVEIRFGLSMPCSWLTVLPQ